MNVFKNKGIIYSNYVLEAINNYYVDGNKFYCGVETFYNCREQGYVLEFHSTEEHSKSICVWVCAQRNSDEPMIVWEETVIPKENANMYTEESYYERTQVFKTIDEATNKVIELVNDYFKEEK